jgi:hypothetical protein
VKSRILLTLVAALAVCASAGAGQSCEPRQPKPVEVRAGLQLAHKVQQHLEALEADVAIVGRIGRDLSEYRWRYSHIGLAVRDRAQNRWNVVHLLNHCGKADSGLHVQGLGNFFLDDLFRFEAMVLLPCRDMQVRLAAAIADGSARALHQPSYSLIAHPYSVTYQNSNQWPLELAAVLLAGGEVSRAAAHARLMRDGFQPSVLHLPPLKRLGARLFAANTRFDDQSNEEWSTSRYQIVSAESVLAWFARADRPVGQSVVTLP